jgi:hypothetical protein
LETASKLSERFDGDIFKTAINIYYENRQNKILTLYTLFQMRLDEKLDTKLKEFITDFTNEILKPKNGNGVLVNLCSNFQVILLFNNRNST